MYAVQVLPDTQPSATPIGILASTWNKRVADDKFMKRVLVFWRVRSTVPVDIAVVWNCTAIFGVVFADACDPFPVKVADLIP
jgi:hypothetical protein